MAENVFEAVKQSVSTREAAEFYGIKVSRTGMACCPFHDDKNPSMKVDQRFHCFGCGEDGDVIDFTAKLFDLSPKEAAEKLAQDFGLIYDSQAPPRRRYVRQKNEAQKFREDRQRCYRVLSDYYYLLKKWEADRSPRTPEEEPHPRFVEAIQKKAYVEYLLDLFLYESEEEQKAWIAEHTAEITHLERRLKIMAENKPTNRERLREITDGIEQGIKELFESEKYMGSLSVMTGLPRSFPGRVPQSASGSFWKAASLPPMWSLQKRQAMNAPSSRKSSGICITISVRTQEKADICPACQRSKAMVSRRRPAA